MVTKYFGLENIVGNDKKRFSSFSKKCIRFILVTSFAL